MKGPQDGRNDARNADRRAKYERKKQAEQADRRKRLMVGALSLCARAERGADVIPADLVLLGQRWNPRKDESFVEMDGVVWQLALECLKGKTDLRRKLFNTIVAAYTGAPTEAERDTVRHRLQVAATTSEFHPSWVTSELTGRGFRWREPNVPPSNALAELTKIVGKGRAYFLLGLQPRHGERLSFAARRLAWHPWALFVNDDEWSRIRRALGELPELPRVEDPTGQVIAPGETVIMAEQHGLLALARERRGEEHPGQFGATHHAINNAVLYLAGEKATLDPDASADLLRMLMPVAGELPEPRHGTPTEQARELLKRGLSREEVSVLTRKGLGQVGKIDRARSK